MAKREYPKMLIASVKGVGYGDNPFGKLREKFVSIVWNQTEYNSFISHYQPKYHISERKPKWKELKDMNLFSKIYYKFPVGITYGIGTVLGFAIGHIDDIIKFGTKVSQLINPK